MGTDTNEALNDIIERARLLAQRREHLGTLVRAMNEGWEALKADNLPQIKAAIEGGADAWKALESMVLAHPELFDKPRKLTAHGITFGYEKGKGGLEIDNPDRTVELIRRHLPDQADVLITVRESPVKTALAQLSAAELKRVGVEVKGTGDVVVIRPADGEIDKVVRALVRAAVDDDAREA